MGGRDRRRQRARRRAARSGSRPASRRSRPPPSRPPPRPALAGRRVLVVDDNATNRADPAPAARPTGGSGSPRWKTARRPSARSGRRRRGPRVRPRRARHAACRAWTGSPSRGSLPDDPAIAGVKLVLLTSFGQKGHGAEATQAGISGYLTKPVDEADLHDCLSRGPGRAPRRAVLVTRHSLREAPSAGLGPHAGGRGQRGQPEGRGDASWRSWATAWRWRTTAARPWRPAREPRYDARPHGLPDAGDGRLRGHREDPRAGGGQGGIPRSSP